MHSDGIKTSFLNNNNNMKKNIKKKKELKI